MSAVLPTLASAQDGTDIVRGRVVTGDGRPVVGAFITITGAQSQSVRTTRTNDKGVYTALFASGEGEYHVTVRSMGFAPRTVRVTRIGESSVLVADVDLVLLPIQLEPVVVTADRPRPARAGQPSVGGIERDLSSGALFSLDPSDLVALAASVPGVFAILGANGDTSAFSVLGAPPSQNRVVVDGSTFSGAALPRDAVAGARLSTTTFDPGRGQFSGGQLVATTRRGTDAFQATVRGTRADPRLAWADAASPVAVPLTQSISGSASGPIRRGKAHYLGALEVHRSASDAFSLLDPRPAVVAQYGLSPDTVAALTAALGALRVPLNTDAIPDDRTTSRDMALLRLDVTPTATTSLTLRADGAVTRQGRAGLSPLGFPSLGAASHASQHGLQVSASAYVGGFLDELRSSVRLSASSTEPYVALSGGVVRVGVEYPDGRDGLTSLRFGGGSFGSSATRSTRWETTNELSWLTTDSRHRVKLGQSIAVERTATSQTADRFGTFTYQSLTDLEANRPASYTRTLVARERSSSSVIGALWLSDEWRPAPTLQLQYGMRLDLARPSTTPAYNPALDSVFFMRTDRVPRDIGFSPRIGFTWSTGTGEGGMRPPPMMGEGLSPITVGSGQGITVSGGIGAFRGVIPAARIAGLGDATGLPSTTRYLMCVGDATPVPDWSAPGGAAPETCRDGAAPVEFSSSQPSVTVFDPSFRAPLTWRANVAIQGLWLRGWELDVRGMYSLGVNGESGLDQNLRRTTAFTLADEGDRPVFVLPASIVAATGAIAPGASRVTDRFGRVTRLISDLRSIATQLQVTLAPPRPLFGKLFVNTSYTYSHQRAQERGFTGSTDGDPFVRQWAPGPQPAHQIEAMTFARFWWLSLGVRLNVTSGTAYTPVVAGDLNGDGIWNDRAFIFDPATSADSTLAAQMSTLLASAPSQARTCLRAQLGRIAGGNSCRTGWQVRPDLSLNFAPPQTFGIGDRLRASLTMTNATGALFRLLGLSNTSLARATAFAPPDPTLLYVTGFDSTSRHFRYRVNQQFGDGQAYGALARPFTAPFRVQIGLEYRFGGPPPARGMMARSLGLVAERGRGPLTADQVREQLRRLTDNPVTPVLERRDSLRLTRAQIADLEAIRMEVRTRADSVLEPLVAHIVARGRKLSDVDVRDRIGRLFPEMRRLMLAAAARVEEVLTNP